MRKVHVAYGLTYDQAWDHRHAKYVVTNRKSYPLAGTEKHEHITALLGSTAHAHYAKAFNSHCMWKIGLRFLAGVPDYLNVRNTLLLCSVNRIRRLFIAIYSEKHFPLPLISDSSGFATCYGISLWRNRNM